MKKTILLFVIIAFLTGENQGQTVTDYDGNVYNTLTIGTQEWMSENLKTTHYRDGVLIPNITNSSNWLNLTTGARCYYQNDSITYTTTYGAIYNGYTTTNVHNLCPTGWHVPTDGEWNILEKHLDITVDTTATGLVGTDIGSKLKEIGTTHWNSPNTGANNSSGFTALPGGFRQDVGTFLQMGSNGFWWTTTSCGSWSAWRRKLNYDDSQISRDCLDKVRGYSIRCIKDSIVTNVNDINYLGNIQIFPNPCDDKLYIDFVQRSDLKIQIYSMVGECVLQRELNKSKNEINISFLTAGLYIIKVTSADWTVQKKIIKQ